MVWLNGWHGWGFWGLNVFFFLLRLGAYKTTILFLFVWQGYMKKNWKESKKKNKKIKKEKKREGSGKKEKGKGF